MKNVRQHRRSIFKNLLLLPLIAASGLASASSVIPRREKKRFRISLNAYSFNSLLSTGAMTLDELLDYCAANHFDAVDLTGYYFPGYPAVPPDEYIYHIKQKAFLLGLDISGSGVRNDFTNPDEGKRKSDVRLIKQWIEVASKLGAPVLRIFSGTQQPAEFSRAEILNWMVRDIQECVQYGKEHGVVIAIQNHNDFIRTAAETKEILSRVNSPWFGLILDIGSYRNADPYAEIREMAPLAVSWQLKENIFVNGIEEKTDLKRIIQIVRESGYRGYLPIETLGAGDPKVKVAAYIVKVLRVMSDK